MGVPVAKHQEAMGRIRSSRRGKQLVAYRACHEAANGIEREMSEDEPILGDGLRANIERHTNRVVFDGSKEGAQKAYDSWITEAIERNDAVTLGLLKHLAVIFK